MVFIDVAVDTIVHSPPAGIFRAIARWIAEVRAENKRKATLQSLLFAPEHRLRDLGFDREELVQALQRRHH